MPLVDIFLNFVQRKFIFVYIFPLTTIAFIFCLYLGKIFGSLYTVNQLVFILYNIILSSLHSNTSCIHQFRCYQGVLKHKRILRVVHHLFCECSKFTKVFNVKLMNISPLISKGAVIILSLIHI